MTGPTSDDEEFERIVAGLELSIPDLDAPAEREPEPEPRERPEPHDVFASYDVFQPQWSDPVADEDDDPAAGEFVPPEPEPLPPGDRVSRWAWGGLIGGPIVLFVLAVTGSPVPDIIPAAAVIAFVVALLVLLVRRGDHDRGDDPDHGAVI